MIKKPYINYEKMVGGDEVTVTRPVKSSVAQSIRDQSGSRLESFLLLLLLLIGGKQLDVGCAEVGSCCQRGCCCGATA